ncbi:hypothetical protein EON65_50250 [archaeon]|nr:MAG: hypothetical protein EON65_50250 [archaeon]
MKNKLPKGAYALMLTMYDRLGGYPLCWSHIGATGIGARRPGITKVIHTSYTIHYTPYTILIP